MHNRRIQSETATLTLDASDRSSYPPRKRFPPALGRSDANGRIDSGARAALGANRRADPTGEGAFTLVEIMVVVVILGILAATIIPQFMGTTDEAKVSTAKASIAQLESSLERFRIHLDRYPTTEEGLKVLVDAPPGEEKKWRGPYINQLRQDPWGHPYQYRFPAVQRKSGFDLWSRGADGADGGEKEAADIGNW
jgi:general secretion pathway protein G